MKEATDFYYAGTYSVDLGISQCHVSVGMLEEGFLAEQSINEISIRGNDVPYFVDTKRSPLVIDLEFCFDEAWDEDAIRAVARLFANQTYYQEFYTTLNTSRRWRCIYTGSPTLLHNSLSQGYVKMQLRCDSAYTYSPQYLSSEIKTSEQDIAATGTNSTGIIATSIGLATGNYIVNVSRDNAIREVLDVPSTGSITVATVTGQTVGDIFDKYTGTSTSYTFANNGDVTIKPEIQILSIATGNTVSIVNTTNGNQELTFDSLISGEYLYIDCDKEIILSDQTGIYRYSNMSATSEFLEMVYGNNVLTIDSDCIVQIRYYLATLQG